MLLAFLKKVLSMLVRIWRRSYNTLIGRYLHDKNILEYVQILVTDGGFMILWILYIEGHSNYYIISLRNYDELLKFLQPKRMSTTMWPM